MTEQLMITKVLNFEVKEVAPRTLEFVGSTEDTDRMGDIIMASGWKLANYKKNPVFLWAHNYQEPPIGKTVKVWVSEGKLRFHVEFAEKDTYEFADTIYKLYKGGFLRATSVGFMPIKSEPIEQKEDEDSFFHQPTRYLQQDLLELSGCPVPANPHALAEAKRKGILSLDQLSDFSKEALIEITANIKATNHPNAEERPYPNEHACRLKNPADFQEGSFRRGTRNHEGKEYSVIMGKLKGETTMTDQAFRYKKDVWKEGEASKHCKDHDGTFEPAGEEAIEEIENAGLQSSDSTSDVEVEIREEIKRTVNEISQSKLGDEMAYVGECIESAGMNDENVALAWELVRTIFQCVELRETGNDIPADIAEKIGAVLNKANRDRLEKAKELIQIVLDSAEKPEESEPEKSLPEMKPEDVAKIFSETLEGAIDKARGKVK